MKQLKIACIYFPINSVGGINTAAQVFKKAATQKGDIWHVLRCSNGPRGRARLFDKPRAVRGGDTYMTIDGEASHHISQIDNTVKFLEKNYDALFFVHACCHPTKAYGRIPYWAEIYKRVRLPKLLRFGDAHYSTYSWIDDVIPYCSKIFVNQKAYAASLPSHILKRSPSYLPMAFLPHPEFNLKKTKKRWSVWTAQAKTVKGYPGFVKVLPKIDSALGIFSSGVYYYTLRTTPGWVNGIGVDTFQQGYADLKGPSNHIYYGFIPYSDIQRVYAKAWASIDLQGYGRGKRHEYKLGSYNNAELDALWGGCRLVVHENMKKSPIPDEYMVTVAGPEELPAALKDVVPLSARELREARDWLVDTHGAEKVYQKIRKAVLEAYDSDDIRI